MMTYSTAPVEDNNTEYGTYYIYWKAVSSLILVLAPSRITSSSCTPQICAPYKVTQSCFAGNEDVCAEWWYVLREFNSKRNMRTLGSRVTL